MWALVAAVAATVAIVVVVAGMALGGDDSPATKAEYQVAVVSARDRTDYVFGRFSKAQSAEELLERMDEAAAAINDAATELDEQPVPEGFEDETDQLVAHMKSFSVDIQGTADQARVPGFEEVLFAPGGLSFPGWDKMNQSFADLREQGIAVPALARHTAAS
jgi:hypothetical protein